MDRSVNKEITIGKVTFAIMPFVVGFSGAASAFSNCSSGTLASFCQSEVVLADAATKLKFGLVPEAAVKQIWISRRSAR
jgi:hypothetical protein